ncbi:hypothetical protein FDP41_004824 [Naegleria fowleri]|uniref:EF-hand domain-containing protein n=1 Tax=Naegleria fowleri TaxID=5763 RepID=A0A6A5BTA1_NAEFO|nr:uncharacterized protein FDP41_004824 [Naegleria fowleri]KAF0976149.1 hypothetical protein FDP41_004824 [Naegleria fowleri]CAG4709680.1 unnamed protein product [Naegleria fowleri]
MGKFEKLSEQQQDQIRIAFKQCDKDGNNVIDVSELKEILKALGEEGTDTQAKELMKEIDDDGNGLITFDEFKEAMASWMMQ